MLMQERQEKLLSGFAFCCWCEACQADYPRMKSLRSGLPEDTEDKFDQLREEVRQQFRQGGHKACLQHSREMVELLERAVIPRPHRNYELAALSMLSCLWKLHGNQA